VARDFSIRTLGAHADLEIAARKLVKGTFVGYTRVRTWYSVDSSTIGNAPGDDLRSVDWKVWARKDKFYVKRFEMESQLKATIVLDSSKSMDFGTGKLTKLEYGSYLAAMLAYTLIHQNDMAGLVTFDSAVRT